MPKRKPRKAKVNRNHIDPLTRFRRALYSEPNFRSGLSKARRITAAEYLPKIVTELSENPTYRTLFLGEAFPATFSDFESRPLMEKCDAATEFLWCASVVALELDAIKQFLELKGNFDNQIINGFYDDADNTLTAIEDRHGVSIWLIAKRIQLIQLRDGIGAQKKYLSALLEVSGLTAYAGFMAYYFSVRAEDNITIEAFRIDAAILLEENSLLHLSDLPDYSSYHLLSHDLTYVDDPSGPIHLEELHTVIDKYEALVAMLRLQFVRNPRSPFLPLVLKILENSSDQRLKNLSLLHTGTPATEGLFVSLCDSYTLDNPQPILEATSNGFESDVPELLELAARAQLLSRKDTQAPITIAEQIVAAMVQVLLMTDNFNAALQELSKIAFSCGSHPYGAYISAFVTRSHGHALVSNYDEVELLAATAGALDNPWNNEMIAKVHGDIRSESTELCANSTSVTQKLRNAVTQPFEVGCKTIGLLQLPSHRQQLYLGHLAMINSRYADAVEYYENAANSTHPITLIASRKFMFRALFSLQRYKQCMELVCTHYFEHKNSHHLYPVCDLLAVVMSDANLSQLIEAPIIACIAEKHFDHDRDLSDAYDNYIGTIGGGRPTCARQVLDEADPQYRTFFLRYVCVPRILEDSIDFSSIHEVDQERIKICQWLMECDEENAAQYEVEIRSITREAEIASRLQRVENGKIYVDENGIKGVLRNLTQKSFLRWQELRQAPNVDNQSERISRRLGEMLGERESHQPQNIELPASEADRLFLSIFETFVDEFSRNAAYGLDTHVSTTIRHGAFEGHIRSPMAEKKLLNLKRGRSYLPNEFWSAKYAKFQQHEVNTINRALATFSRKVDVGILKFKDNLIQVWSEDVCKEGLFNFHSSRSEIDALMCNIDKSASYEEFEEIMITRCWVFVEESLEEIQNELRGPFLTKMNGAFGALVSTIEAKIDHDRVTDLVDAVAQARTNFQDVLERVCSWFQRVSVLNRGDFSADTAISVALAEIRNCYVTQNFTPKINVNIPQKLRGRHFDGFVEIFFIFLQNSIRHCGLPRGPGDVLISATIEEDQIYIRVTNRFKEDLDLVTLRRNVERVTSEYKQKPALERVRSEIGSGIPKIWRILEFDFPAEHSFDLCIRDDNRVSAEVRFRASEVCI